MENVVFEKNLASHPKENSLSVSHRAENRICPLSNPTFGKLRSWQTSFPASTHIYRTVSLPSPFFSSFFSLFHPHTSFTSIYFHAKIKYVRGDTLLVSQSIFRVSIMLRTVGGTEVSLVSPLLREKEFECISTFLRETCSICSSYFLTCSLAIFVQSFTACLQIVFLFSFFVFA